MIWVWFAVWIVGGVSVKHDDKHPERRAFWAAAVCLLTPWALTIRWLEIATFLFWFVITWIYAMPLMREDADA